MPKSIATKQYTVYDFEGGVRMGSQEGTAKPDQTWSWLRGSAGYLPRSAQGDCGVDEGHSRKEPRLFCIGRSHRGIVTVRFTQRGDHIRIIGAGYWRKGRHLYEKTNR